MRRREIPVILGTTLLFVLGVAGIAPAMPRIREALDLDAMRASLLVSAFALPGIFLAPLFGTILDRTGRKKVLIAALIVYGAAGGLIAAADSLTSATGGFAFILFLRLVQGAANAPLGMIAITLIGDKSGEGERAALLGLNSATLSVGTALWPILGGFLAIADWRHPFLLSLLALPLAAGVIFLLDEPVRTRNPGSNPAGIIPSITAALSGPGLAGPYLAALGSFLLLYGAFLTGLPAALSGTHSMPVQRIGALVSLMSLPTILVAGATKRLLSRWKGRQLIMAGFACYAFSLALFPLASGGWLLPVPVLIFGVAQGLAIPNILILLTARSNDGNRAMVMSVYSVLMHLGQATAPLLAGVVAAGTGMDGVFLGGAGLGLALLVAVSKIIPGDNHWKPEGGR